MPFQKRSIRWLDCNDMLILYEDAGISMADLAVRFRVDKKRVLAILHALGATIRSKGGAARVVAIESGKEEAAPITFRSKSTYAAFMSMTTWLRDRGIDSEVGSAGVGNGFYIEFHNEASFKVFMLAVVKPLPVDEDVDSLYSAITRRWKLSGQIDAGGEEMVDWFNPQLTVTMPTADFVKLAEWVTQKAR